MRLFLTFLFVLNLWTTASVARDDVTGSVRWLAPAIDCSSDRYPHYVNPFNVYAQLSDVLKRRRPDGVLFFSVNITFGFCSPSLREFLPQGGRNLTVISVQKWTWQKLPFVKDVNAYLQKNVEGVSYNKLEIRVSEELLAKELEEKEKVSVVVAYHDFDINGVRARWIFENSSSGIQARLQAIR